MDINLMSQALRLVVGRQMPGWECTILQHPGYAGHVITMTYKLNCSTMTPSAMGDVFHNMEDGMNRVASTLRKPKRPIYRGSKRK